MSKVNLNFSAINNECISSLDNVIACLDEVVAYLQQNSIPSDFYRKDTLANVISDLKNQRANITSVKSWIINSNANYDSMIDKLTIQATKLPAYQEKSRTSII